MVTEPVRVEGMSFTLMSTFFFPVASLVALFCFLKTSHLYWKRRGIPSLRPSFPFGDLKNFLTLRKSMGESYAEIYHKMGNMDYIGVYMFHRPIFVLKNPELIKNFLVKDFEHFHDHGFAFDEKVDPLLANLFMLRGKRWRNLRADMTKTFTSGKMKSMFNMVLACSQELVDYLERSAESQEAVEMKDVMAKFTTDVIASCAFGIQCNSMKNPNAEFRQFGKRMHQLSPKDHLVGLLYLVCPRLASILGIPLTPNCVSVFFRRVVKEIVDMRIRTKSQSNDFIQLLLELKEEKESQGKVTHPFLDFKRKIRT